MRRAPRVGMLFALACMPILCLASSAYPVTVGEKQNGYSICDETAIRLYEEASKAGLDVGRNRVDDGKLLASGKVVPENHPCAWRDKLDLMLHPPKPEPVATVSESVAPTTETVAPAPAPTSSSGGYSIPESIVQCESGGNYSAVNSSSGAYGAYQILPSTSASYGCDMSTPAGQDDCAARIYADSGGSAWVC